MARVMEGNTSEMADVVVRRAEVEVGRFSTELEEVVDSTSMSEEVERELVDVVRGSTEEDVGAARLEEEEDEEEEDVEVDEAFVLDEVLAAGSDDDEDDSSALEDEESRSTGWGK